MFNDGNECCKSGSGLMKLINYAETEVKKKRLYIVGVFNQSIFHILAETQISTMYGYIERLSKKPKNGEFSYFASNDINNLQASNSQF